MRAKLLNVFKASAIACAALGFSAWSAKSADLGLKVSPGAGVGSCSEIVLVCENGRQYPICPIAVSVAGELVTASLYTAPHRATYVRLVPMGVGYRYAGKGIWFDGLRENALLNFGNRSSVACTVSQS
ncbi:hypothetical protein [Afipia birgiae]|jgi:hypothetical protein|uniref:hypothetical protein n=1 Tax=Afipia birgiae TaxID=151414 RepID=UPI0002DBE709|nr:hypothetical protein [Afipia birgiae]MBX9819767.1 hypothetical protein [Afipia birgiae]